MKKSSVPPLRLGADQSSGSSHTAGPSLVSGKRRNVGLAAFELLQEIRTPLETLGYLAYLAEQQCGDPERVRFYMRLAHQHLATINQIASRTMHFAEISEHPAATDLVELTESALQMHYETIQSKQIRLVKELPKGSVAGVHRGQMLQVLSDLIVHALEGLDPEGTLLLRLRRRKNGVHLLIADNGHGITLGQDSHDPSLLSTKRRKGMGIGLALVREIVEDHHGKFSVRSSTRAGHRGTAFKIFLPAAEEND